MSFARPAKPPIGRLQKEGPIYLRHAGQILAVQVHTTVSIRCLAAPCAGHLMAMRETSLYCRPDVVCAIWFALEINGRVLLFAKDKHDKPLGPYELRFLDTDHQLCITAGGERVLIPLEAALPIKDPQRYHFNLTALLSTPRYIRKPTNYVDPDSCRELHRLLSKKKL